MKTSKFINTVMFLFFDFVILIASVFALTTRQINVSGTISYAALPTDYVYEAIYDESEVVAYRIAGFTSGVHATVADIPSEYHELPVWEIGDYAFEQESIERLTIPSTIKSIGNYAFYLNTSLSSVTFEDDSQLEIIGERAFSGYNAYFILPLNQIKIPASVSVIGANAFSYSSLHTLMLSSSLSTQTINASAFSNTNLEDLFLYSDSVVQISTTDVFDNITNNNSNKVNVHVPTAFLTSYSSNANWSTAESNNKIEFEEMLPVNASYTYEFVYENGSIIGASVTGFASGVNLTNVTIPSDCYGFDIIEIGEYAFAQKQIETITIPASVERIASYAFYQNSNLTTVTISSGSTIKVVGNYAFAGLVGNLTPITEIAFPASIQQIGFGAFSNTTLGELVLENSTNIATLIGTSVFYGIDNINADNKVKVFVQSSLFGDYQANANWSYAINHNQIALFISDGIYSYGNITSAGEIIGLNLLGFMEGMSQTNVIIPSQFQSEPILQIETDSFKNQSSIQSVSLPSSVTSIGNSAFENCGNLSSINLSANITSIGNNAFSGCDSLTSITLPADMTTLGSSLFSGCTSLTSITIPALVATINAYAFYNCTSLQSVSFASGSQLTSIGNDVFNGCENLTSLTIPTGVLAVSAQTFSNSGLLDLYLSKSTILTLSNINAFNGITNSNGNVVKVFVPSSIFANYQSDPTWSGAVSGAKIEFVTTITLDTHGGSNQSSGSWTWNGSSYTKQLAVGDPLGTLPTSSLSGYSFLGWFTSSSGGSSVNASTTISTITTYHAHWEYQYVTITLDSNGGSGSTTGVWSWNSSTLKYSSSFSIGSTLGTLPTPSKDGYAFVGWFTSGGVQINSSTQANNYATYYAHWEELQLYAISLRTMGGVGNDENGWTYYEYIYTKQIIDGNPLGTLPTPSLSGYSFLGWFTSSSGGSAVDSQTTVSTSITYYAQWESLQLYTITLNATGGSGNDENGWISSGSSYTKQFLYGSTLGNLPTPTPINAEYKFVGWFTALSSGSEVNSSTVVTGAVIYYAHWQQYEAKVGTTYYETVSDAVDAVASNGTISLLKNIDNPIFSHLKNFNVTTENGRPIVVLHAYIIQGCVTTYSGNITIRHTTLGSSTSGIILNNGVVLEERIDNQFSGSIVENRTSLTLSPISFSYTGSTRSPSIYVYGNGSTLGSSNYTVSGTTGAVYSGTYSITVTFTASSQFYGSLSGNWYIEEPPPPTYVTITLCSSAMYPVAGTTNGWSYSNGTYSKYLQAGTSMPSLPAPSTSKPVIDGSFTGWVGVPGTVPGYDNTYYGYWTGDPFSAPIKDIENINNLKQLVDGGDNIKANYLAESLSPPANEFEIYFQKAKKFDIYFSQKQKYY